jgi:endonuclease YncB( thermonuclease family)
MLRPSLVTVLTLILTSSAANAETIAGRATVIDGDTLEIHGERIRILDIDAPESAQYCFKSSADLETGAWPCGRQAALALSDWIGQRTVTCDPTKKDRYQRWLARCAVAGQDMAEWLASSGWAVPYRDCKCEEIRALSKDAEMRNAGIWGGEFIMPWEWRKAH